MKEKLQLVEIPSRNEKKAYKVVREDITRREFLKKAAITTGGLVVAGGVVNWPRQGPDNKEVKDINSKKDIINKSEDISINEGETPEQVQIYEEDVKSIKEQIGYDKEGRVKLNSRELINYWKKRYSEDPKMRDSLVRAYYEMGAWENKLRQIFKGEGIPEKFIYLAIPESHFNLQAVSRSKAKGPYQFMYKTAIQEPCCLRINNFIDERVDPLASGRACARLLKDNYLRCNQDWDLALIAYNNGFIWLTPFIKYCKQSGEPVCYKNYQRYMEEVVNNKRAEIKNIKPFPYRVKKNETLTSLANRFSISEAEIIKANRLKSSGLLNGQKLRIPYSGEKKRSIYDREMTGYYENLTYPEKFHAVYELIEDNYVTKKKPEVVFIEYPVKKESRQVLITHLVGPQDTLSSVARKYHTYDRLILAANANNKLLKRIASNKTKLAPIRAISVPVTREEELTVMQFASKMGKSLTKIKEKNPAIKNFNAKVPAGFIIRA